MKTLLLIAVACFSIVALAYIVCMAGGIYLFFRGLREDEEWFERISRR